MVCFFIPHQVYDNFLSPPKKTEADLWGQPLIALVEIPGFEPGQTEPKSVVLPLHHISIPGAKILLILILCKWTTGGRR